MRNKLPVVIFLGGVAMLVSCGTNTSPTATAQTATVNLKDGTTFVGTVTKSDTSSITVQASSGETRSYPMNWVNSVKYSSLPPTSPNTPFSPAAPVVSGNTPEGSVPPPPVIAEPMLTILAGTRVMVRNTGAIRADAAAVGQTYHAVLIGNVAGDDGKVAIPRGSEAMLVVRAAKGGEVQGRSELTLDLDSVMVDGRRYRLRTLDIVEQGEQGLGENRSSAKFVGGGAPLGTIVSAVPGGGKDATIGPAAGMRAAGAKQAVVRGSSVSVPADSILTFQLESRVEIQPE